MFDTDVFDVILVHKCIFSSKKYDTAYSERRGFDGFVFAVSGSADWIFKDKITTVSTGDIIYLPPDSRYCVSSHYGDFVHYTVNFSATTPVTDTAYKLTPKNTMEFKKMFETLTDVWNNKKSGFRLKSKALLYNLIFSFYNEIAFEGLNTDSFDKIKPATDFIEAHPTEFTSTKTLAEICNLSETHFRRLFNKIHEVSPHEYQMRLRLMKAEDLLLTKLYTVGEVSEICGFSDTNYFSRIFKSRKGISPLKFKQIR